MRQWVWISTQDLPPHVNRRLKELEGVIAELQTYVSRLETITNGDTTPSVLGAAVLLTANSGSTSITTFSDGEAGRSIDFIFGDANTTLVHGTNLQLASNANLTGTAGDTRRFATEDGAIWRETPQTA